MPALIDYPISDIPGISAAAIRKLRAAGHEHLGDLSALETHSLYALIGFDQAKTLLKAFLKAGGEARFSKPDWSEEDWRDFVQQLVDDELVSWNEVAMAICGELNPPQVGTAIASNKSFQSRYAPRKTMQAVMKWFYAQDGHCARCGTRLFLEADHIRSKEDFLAQGRAAEEADTLDNLQLLCKRCNVIKRPSHDLGGISFAPAQAVLIWIILALRPPTKAAFAQLCREHGLTMASIRFDEAWAFAIWLSNEGRYQISEG